MTGTRHIPRAGTHRRRSAFGFRYIPFANLYDLSLAFAFGAGITTLVIAHRKTFAFSAQSIAAGLACSFTGALYRQRIYRLAAYLRFLLASDSRRHRIAFYGVALVCFAVAVVYLLKDGVKTEAMAIWSSIFVVSVIATVSRFSVFTSFTYGASTFLGTQGARSPVPLRADIPYVGPLLALTGLLLIGVIVSFGMYLAKENEAARLWGHRLLKLSLWCRPSLSLCLFLKSRR
jgi:hypothetical protein